MENNQANHTRKEPESLRQRIMIKSSKITNLQSKRSKDERLVAINAKCTRPIPLKLSLARCLTMNSFETNFLYNFEKTHCLDGAKTPWSVVSDWKQNSNCCLFGCGNVTPLPWHTETRRSFLEEKRPFAVEKYTTTTFHCYSHRERRTEKSVAYRGDMEFLLHTTREYNGKGHRERRPFGRLFR